MTKIILKSQDHKIKVQSVGKRGPQGIQDDPATNMVTSVNGRMGDVVLDYTDVGADGLGSAEQALQDANDYTEAKFFDPTNFPVQSVNGHTGVVALNKTDVGLQNVNNTSDSNKPVTTAQAAANVEDRKRENHTGTQVAATISDFVSVASSSAPVQSVAGKQGAVTLNKNDVGLTNVDNTSDANKPVSTAVATQLALKEDKANKGVPNGYASLGSDGKLIAGQLPELPIVDTYVVASQAAMLALTQADQGDVAIRTDLNKTFILSNNSPTVLSSWKELLTPTDAVSSVNGRVGAVVGLAEQSSLTAHTSNTSNPHSVTKSQVGLGAVDNTTDLNKPVSTATQTALDTKVDKVTTTNVLYGTDANGNQVPRAYDAGAGNATIVQRTGSGQVAVANATVNTSAVNKGQMDAADATKATLLNISQYQVPIRTTTGVGEPNTGFLATENATANSIAFRTTNGVMSVGTPTATTHATTKAYVDSAVSVNAYTVPFRNNAAAGQPNDFITVGQTSASGNSLARRTSDGKIFTEDATDPKHAVNKSQLDAKVTGVNTSKITVSATEPAGAVIGDLWVDIS